MATLRFNGLPAAVGLHQRVNTQLLTPRMCVATLIYTMVGTEVAGDIIKVPLQQGDRILPHLSQVSSDGIATTATLKIGDDDIAGPDDDRYGAAIDVAAAGLDSFNAATKGVAATTSYSLSKDANLTVTFATLGTPVAGKKLEFLVFYVGA
jgi:hypothetical protein